MDVTEIYSSMLSNETFPLFICPRFPHPHTHTLLERLQNTQNS